MRKFYSRQWWMALPVLLLLATSCNRENAGPTPAKTDGWVPVYSSDQEATAIASTTPKAIEKGGKIYTKGSLLFQVEAGKGVHVIDISQPASPQKLGFITVRGAQEMAVMNNYMYVNNLNDLVVVDIGTVSSVKEVGRMKSVFHMVDQQYPPEAGWFECIDATKGTVVGWEQKTIEHPKCQRN